MDCGAAGANRRAGRRRRCGADRFCGAATARGRPGCYRASSVSKMMAWKRLYEICTASARPPQGRRDEWDRGCLRGHARAAPGRRRPEFAVMLVDGALEANEVKGTERTMRGPNSRSRPTCTSCGSWRSRRCRRKPVAAGRWRILFRRYTLPMQRSIVICKSVGSTVAFRTVDYIQSQKYLVARHLDRFR